MAEFCTQCADLYDFPDSDGRLAAEALKLTPEECLPFLCEGCGPTYIDHEGRCMGGCVEPAHEVTE